MRLNPACLYGLGKDCNDILKRFRLAIVGKRPSSGRLGELKLAALRVCFFNWLARRLGREKFLGVMRAVARFYLFLV